MDTATVKSTDFVFLILLSVSSTSLLSLPHSCSSFSSSHLSLSISSFQDVQRTFLDNAKKVSLDFGSDGHLTVYIATCQSGSYSHLFLLHFLVSDLDLNNSPQQMSALTLS